jgi:hypothetical protein
VPRRSAGAVGAAAVDVDLFEQSAQAAQFPDGSRVGTADDGVTQGPEPYQLGDGEPCSVGDDAELLLLAWRDANVPSASTPISKKDA